MSDIAIKVENLGKLYRLGEVGTGTLSQDLKRWWAINRGKEDPFAKIGEANDRTTKGASDFVWALKDVSFEVKQGEVLGIIGRNGAGKSTLLKLLSKVTAPSTGNIKVKGRIASLLEVGTGFHPDLTGRENVFLNGAILGMSRKEINSKFDEIVDFAGVERYIDTPVKRYSSGMYVRLAFAVAAFLEPEILIVDEVLAVGDAEFQRKCLGRMRDVSKNDGRTVLFVSHNMAAVQKLCNRGIFFRNGQIHLTGEIDHVISKYLESSDAIRSIYEIPKPDFTPENLGFAYCLKVEDINGNLINEIPVGKAWQIRVQFKLNKKVEHFIIALGIVNTMDVNLRTTWSKEMDLDAGEYEALFKEDQLLLAAGTYQLALGLSSYERAFQYIENVAAITISDVPDSTLDKSIVRTTGVGLILNPMDIEILNLTKSI
ncbi:polysaccharide ABC transporter ATP-binding protein [Chitinophagaceae bacterium LB-8]|uniref:Polysaccharide ABC transporter ATP-binding protein n=1 Tax=Paraflavisolibacter caeni TaxID=2982496 RepID=A0A9X3BIG0_9BACT|nr:polysaccharide ABC transporter ATP-binding protein [Paraflavisolibacter caeni]MCU7551287.1 polysaccharide ABC transporter ATP-binding protein [Paraflavisolibacter caeni]